MNCRRFLHIFSDVHDGVAPASVVRAAEAHAAVCASCRQYQRVVEEGVAILRGEGVLEVPEDFEPRLRHRLVHVDEEDTLLSHANSGASAMAVLSIALVLTAVAWSPLLRPGVPQVELPPLVVSTPPEAVRAAVSRLVPLQAGPSGVRSVRAAGLWDDAPELLFEYSRLSQRYRQRAIVRQTAYDPDRQ